MNRKKALIIIAAVQLVLLPMLIVLFAFHAINLTAYIAATAAIAILSAVAIIIAVRQLPPV